MRLTSRPCEAFCLIVPRPLRLQRLGDGAIDEIFPALQLQLHLLDLAQRAERRDHATHRKRGRLAPGIAGRELLRQNGRTERSRHTHVQKLRPGRYRRLQLVALRPAKERLQRIFRQVLRAFVGAVASGRRQLFHSVFNPISSLWMALRSYQCKMAETSVCLETHHR